jgi:hypothetical protein
MGGGEPACALYRRNRRSYTIHPMVRPVRGSMTSQARHERARTFKSFDGSVTRGDGCDVSLTSGSRLGQTAGGLDHSIK